MLGKSISSMRTWAGVIASASLVACATPNSAQEHGAHHEGQDAGAAQQGGGMMGGGQAGPGMMGGSQQGGGMMGGAMMGGGQTGKAGAATMPMDKDMMCSFYRDLQAAPTQQQRQALIDQHMQGMSPEMREHHLDMMRQQCSK